MGAMWETLFAAIGFLTVAILELRAVVFIWRHFLSPSASLSKYKGSWAVVTGASSGIGAGLSRALAARGVNVALIARGKGEKLEAVAAECKALGVQTAVLPFDFATADDEQYAALARMLSELHPSILVNNVGVNVDFPTHFSQMEDADMERIVTVNVSAANKMTRMLLPGMVESKKGIVLFMSSSAGSFAPGPLLGPYTASKAYMDQLAIAISGEVARDGVTVHSVAPFFVESAMAKMRRSFTVPDADTFARATLRMIGGPTRMSPYWPHGIMAAVLGVLPMKMQVKYVADLHEGLRKRAIRKRDRLAKQR